MPSGGGMKLASLVSRILKTRTSPALPHRVKGIDARGEINGTGQLDPTRRIAAGGETGYGADDRAKPPDINPGIAAGRSPAGDPDIESAARFNINLISGVGPVRSCFQALQRGLAQHIIDRYSLPDTTAAARHIENGIDGIDHHQPIAVFLNLAAAAAQIALPTTA